MTSIHSSSALIFLLLTSLGLCWTSALEQQQQQQNNVSFASSSSPSYTLPVKAGRKEKVQPIQARRMKSNSRMLTNRNSERDLITKIRRLPKDKLNRYKIEAARHLQANLIRAFQVLSNTGGNIPGNVRHAAGRALVAARSGSYNPAIVRHLPSILKHGSHQQGQPAKQLQIVLTNILPHVPSGSRAPLQGVLGFISANLLNVNGLLVNVLGTVPDLLAGVIRSLTLNLGAVTGALTGTVASLGILLGGALG